MTKPTGTTLFSLARIFRNTPLLVQLLVIYFVVFLQLPGVRDSIRLPLDMYLSQRGFYMPRPEVAPDGPIWLTSLLIAIVAFFTLWILAGRREAEGRRKMVRTREWKYVHDPLGDLDELYDLSADPWELENVAADPSRADVLAEMRLRLADWSIATEDSPPVLLPEAEHYF